MTRVRFTDCNREPNPDVGQDSRWGGSHRASLGSMPAACVRALLARGAKDSPVGASVVAA